MATVPAVHVADEDITVKRVKWLAIPNGDQGAPVTFGAWKDRSVQVTGTFGAGGSVTIQGSNDGGTTWITLTDAANAALTFSANGLKAITELPYQIRPSVQAGDGTTAINVWIAGQGGLNP